jgi:hypothetical protein
MATIDIHVVDGEDAPVSGADVTVYFSRGSSNNPLEWATTHLSDTTDEDGQAEFDIEHEPLPDSVEVYVDGEACAEYDFEDGASFTVSV